MRASGFRQRKDLEFEMTHSMLEFSPRIHKDSAYVLRYSKPACARYMDLAFDHSSPRLASLTQTPAADLEYELRCN